MRKRVGGVGLAALLIAAALSPAIASAATQTSNTTISAQVNAVVSISSGPSVSISLTPTGSGVLSNASDTVSVSTNNATGYTLTLNDSDATTTLASGSDTFTAASGTKTAPAALTNGTWGWAVANGTTGIGTNGFDASYASESNNTSSTSKWAGIAASGSPVMIKTTASTASADTTTVWYAAKAAVTQPTGTYTDTVTYTATTN